MPTGPPTPSAPDVPSGYRMPDGFATRISFALDTTLQIWEVSVQPPGVDAGEPINITTMHNTRWRTMHPKKLLSLTECNTSCGYDPNCLTNILTLCGKNTVITVTFPPGESPATGDTICFYGYLRSFKPNGMKEGEFPLADVVFQPTCLDDAGAEQAPVYTPGTGTA